MKLHRSLTLALVVACGFAVGADLAEAASKCKAKVDKKTGTIFVSASTITGTALWGKTAGNETNAFVDPGGCLGSGKVNKCLIGTAGTDAAKTPPAGCEIFVADDGAEDCSAFIKGCTPRNADSYSVTLYPPSGGVVSSVGDWVDSVVPVGTGAFSINFQSGTFSQLPGCTGSVYAAGYAGEVAFTADVAANDENSALFAVFDENGAASDCSSLGVVVCYGTMTCTGR